MSELWYYRKSGQLFGPMTHDALSEAAGRGELGRDDEVRSGHGAWQPAGALFEVAGHVEESPVARRADPFAEILGEAPEVEFDSSASPALAAEPVYFCRLAGKQEGPFRIEELQDLIDTGRLQKYDRCLAAGTRFWLPCSELTELDFSQTPLQDDALGEEEDDAEFDDDQQSQPLGEETDRNLDADDDNGVGDEIGNGRTDSEPAANRSTAAPQSVPAMSPAAPVPAPPRKPAMPSPVKTSGRRTKRVSASAGLALPPARFFIIGGAVVALVVIAGYFLSNRDSTISGMVSVDGAPVPIGIVSIRPRAGTKGPSLSLPVVNGQFQANADVKLADGSYDVSVTVGNPLKMPVPQLAGTEFEPINGARFETHINTRSLPGQFIELQFPRTDAVDGQKKSKNDRRRGRR